MEQSKKKRGRPKSATAVPKTLRCSVTGVMVKTNPIQYYNQLQKSGLTAEQFAATYISRKGRRILHEKAMSEVPLEKKPDKVFLKDTPVKDDFDDADLDWEDELRHLKMQHLAELEEKLKKVSALRSYPIVCYDTVMETYREYIGEEYSPKEAWKLACHLHRNSPRLYMKVAAADKLIPYQKGR